MRRYPKKEEDVQREENRGCERRDSVVASVGQHLVIVKKQKGVVEGLAGCAAPRQVGLEAGTAKIHGLMHLADVQVLVWVVRRRLENARIELEDKVR